MTLLRDFGKSPPIYEVMIRQRKTMMNDDEKNDDLAVIVAGLEAQAASQADRKEEMRALLGREFKDNPPADDNGKRFWMLTLQASAWSRAEVEYALKDYRWVGQLELGEKTGRYHWQLCIWNTNKQTSVPFSTLKNKFPIGSEFQSLNEKKGTKNQCVRYVTKAETAVGVPVGTMTDEEIAQYVAAASEDDKKRAFARSADLAAAYQAVTTGRRRVSDVVLENPSLVRSADDLDQLRKYHIAEDARKVPVRPIEVHYIYGPTRCGKTTYAEDNSGGSFWPATDWTHDPFDGYDYEDTLILEDYHGQLDFFYLLRLLEGRRGMVSIRYHNKPAVFGKVFVLSNEPIDHLYRDIQSRYPGSWKAFLARFDDISRMEYGGKLTIEATPKADVAKEAGYVPSGN